MRLVVMSVAVSWCVCGSLFAATNTPPVFAPMTNRFVINGGNAFVVTNLAGDADVPAQSLTCSLPVAPSGATVNPLTGVVTWNTTTNQAGTSNRFEVVVTDDGSPPLSATNSFTVFVRPARPNILIVVTDDQGFHDISAHGCEAPTPNMDRLGREGIRLERFYATPVCSVTRSTLMTGRNPIRTNVTNDRGLELREQTLPLAFKSAGYQTYMCGKWHLGGLYNNTNSTVINGVTNVVVREGADYQPQVRGWDSHYGEYTGAIGYSNHVSQENGQLDWWLNGQTNLDAGWSTDLLANKAVQALQQRDPSKPALVYLAFNAVHGPVSAPTNYTAKYAAISNVNRRTLLAALDQMDVALGRVLDSLDAEDIASNTVVVFFGDNGGQYASGGSNLPLRGDKGDLFDGGIHTPAAIRWPGVLPTGVTNCQQFVWVGDWFPTLCAAAGISPLNTKPFDGVNMWPLLLAATNGTFNPSSYRGVPLVSGSSAGSGVFDVFSNGTNLTMFKLIRDKLPGTGSGFTNYLFDIIADPYESNDVASVPAYSNIVATLTNYYDAIKAESYTPYIGAHPQGQTVPEGSNVTLWAMTTIYAKKPACQWRRNGVSIGGATNLLAVDSGTYLARLDFTNATPGDAGAYDLVASSQAVGWPTAVTSQTATLIVLSTSVVETVVYDLLLGRPTDTSIAVSVLSSNDMQVYFEFGTQSGAYSNQTATTFVTNGAPREIEISGLQKDRAYFYRIRYCTNGVAPFAYGVERTFHTQRSRGRAFTFDIEADPHYQDNTPSVWRQTLTNVLADAPDFLIDLGDTFMGEKYAATNPATLSQQGIVDACAAVRGQFFNISGHSVPLFLVGGNHDPELGWLLTNSSPHANAAVWGAQARELYYPCPVPGGFYSGATNVDFYQQQPRDGYYAFEWGDALIVTLDPFWFSNQSVRKSSNPWAWTLGSNQYFWLKRTLETSNAKFKFVFAHHLVGGSFDTDARGGLEFAPYFEWGGLNTNGTYGFATNRPGWPMPIQDLLLSNNVQVFFHGHDHLYVKQDFYADGITNGEPDLIYQEVPQPSHYPYDATSYATGTNISYSYQSGVFYGSAGHLRVIVSPTNATVDYVRSYRASDIGKTNRTVTYSYNIPAPVSTTTNASITSAQPMATGSFMLQWNAQPGVAYFTQWSSDLAQWNTVPVGQTNSWLDTNMLNAAWRFYRVTW